MQFRKMMEDLMPSLAGFEEVYQHEPASTLENKIKDAQEEFRKQNYNYFSLYDTHLASIECEGMKQAPESLNILPDDYESEANKLTMMETNYNNEPWQRNQSCWITPLFFIPAMYMASLWSHLAWPRSSTKTSHHSPATTDDDDIDMKSRTNIQKIVSWIAVMTFPGCFSISNYSHYSSLVNDQTSLSIWLALLVVLNFTSFFASLLLMAIYQARFTPLQIALLLTSAILIIMHAYVPVITGWLTPM